MQDRPSIPPYGLFEINMKRLPDIYYYEKWGGPSYTAGMWASWDEIPPKLRNFILADIENNPKSIYAPVDNQDRCYMYHDICCGEGRIECRGKSDDCYVNCVYNKESVCDQNLWKCLLSAGFSSDLLAEAHRIAAIPIFILRPPFRNAIQNNKRNGTSYLFSFEFKWGN